MNYNLKEKLAEFRKTQYKAFDKKGKFKGRPTTFLETILFSEAELMLEIINLLEEEIILMEAINNR